MASVFTYSVANDTLFGAANGGNLKVEIEKSTITIALDSIDTINDDLVITFKADISTAEETVLDGVVAAHNGFLKLPVETNVNVQAGDGEDIGRVGDALKVASVEVEDNEQTVLWVDKRFTNGSNFNMDVNGSSTPQDFTFGPPSGQIWFVNDIQIIILDPGSPDIDDFGSIGGGLNNGVQLIQQINSTEYELGNFADNGSLSLCFADSAYSTSAAEDGIGWLDEDDMFMGIKKLSKPIRLNGTNGDKLIFRIRDNLNAIQRFQAVARAWYFI